MGGTRNCVQIRIYTICNFLLRMTVTAGVRKFVIEIYSFDYILRYKKGSLYKYTLNHIKTLFSLYSFGSGGKCSLHR